MQTILIATSVFALLALVVYFLLPKYTLPVVLISRMFVGLVFVFSGFMKLIDPLGSNYKFIDYFETMGLELLIPYALPLAMLMCIAEFAMGAGLMFSSYVKLNTRLVTVFMIIFTPLTLWLALTNPVPDCGCFGDAVKLTNWETFWKNIVLDVFVVILLLSLKKVKMEFTATIQSILFSLGIGVGFALTINAYNHLPLIDFMPWHVGAQLAPENPLPKEYYVIYKNKKSGEVKEFPVKNMPTDSVFMANWQWQDTKIVDPNNIKDHGLTIEDEDGNPVTEQFVNNAPLQLILVSYDLATGKWEKLKQLQELINKATEQGVSIILLTSTPKEKAKDFVTKNKLNVSVYYADDTALKALIRANPGLILLKKAKVVGKWHINDLPTMEDVNKTLK